MKQSKTIMNKKDYDEIEDIIYGIKPIFPVGIGMNRVASVVWERIKQELKWRKVKR